MSAIVIPKIKGLPFLGSLFDLKNRPLEFFSQIANTHQGIVRIKALDLDLYFIFDPRLSQMILANKNNQFRYWDNDVKVLSQFLGKGLIANNDYHHHKLQRKLIQPAFHFRSLEHYTKTMIDYSADYISSWLDNEKLDVSDEMVILTVNIVAKTMLGIDKNESMKDIFIIRDSIHAIQAIASRLQSEVDGARDTLNSHSADQQRITQEIENQQSRLDEQRRQVEQLEQQREQLSQEQKAQLAEKQQQLQQAQQELEQLKAQQDQLNASQQAQQAAQQQSAEQARRQAEQQQQLDQEELELRQKALDDARARVTDLETQQKQNALQDSRVRNNANLTNMSYHKERTFLRMVVQLSSLSNIGNANQLHIVTNGEIPKGFLPMDGSLTTFFVQELEARQLQNELEFNSNHNTGSAQLVDEHGRVQASTQASDITQKRPPEPGHTFNAQEAYRYSHNDSLNGRLTRNINQTFAEIMIPVVRTDSGYVIAMTKVFQDQLRQLAKLEEERVRIRNHLKSARRSETIAQQKLDRLIDQQQQISQRAQRSLHGLQGLQAGAEQELRNLYIGKVSKAKPFKGSLIKAEIRCLCNKHN